MTPNEDSIGHSAAFYRRQVAELKAQVAELRTALSTQIAYNGVLAERNYQLSRELVGIGLFASSTIKVAQDAA